MIPLGVHSTADEGFPAVDDEAVLGLLHLSAQGIQGLGGGHQPVGLLQPQAGSSHDAGLPRSRGCSRRQNGHQVRDVPGVDHRGCQLAGPGSIVASVPADKASHPSQHLADGLVPLQGVRVHTGNGHALAAHNPHAQPGGGVGPVSLHLHGFGAVIAYWGDAPALRQGLRIHAEVGQRPKGQVNVALGLHLPLHHQAAGLPQQRQGKEQAGDKLRGHIPGQDEPAGGQHAGYVHLAFFRPGGNGAAVFS